MKKNVNYIDAAKFEAIITALGIPMVPQKGFVKCTGAKGRNVYVPLTKAVGRVDLSGFTMEIPGLVTLETPFGAVEQQLDFTLPEAEVLETFTAVLEHMLTLTAREVVRKARAARESSMQGWSHQASKADGVPASSQTE